MLNDGCRKEPENNTFTRIVVGLSLKMVLTLYLRFTITQDIKQMFVIFCAIISEWNTNKVSRKRGRLREISEAQRDVMDEAREIGGGLNEEPPAERFHYRSSGNLTQTKLSVKKKEGCKAKGASIDWGRFVSRLSGSGLDVRARLHRSRDWNVQRRTK